MFDELVKRMRKCATEVGVCKTCELDSNPSCTDVLMEQAADAIEELQQQVEHYHGCMNDWVQEACDLKVMNEQQAKNFDILFNIVLKIVEQIAERLNIEIPPEPQKEET